MNILFGVAVLPVVLLCYYINKRDIEREPKYLLKKVFVFGMLSVIPIIILELLAMKFLSTENNNDLIQLFAATFMGVALIEEFAKWVVVYTTVYNHKEFNHPYDAIVYCVFASLGFALVENVMYVISTSLLVGITRAILTVPSHACDAIVMGYFLSESKKEEHKGNQLMSNRYMALSLLIPITIHAIYDYLLFTEREVFIIIFVVYVSLIYTLCFKIVKQVSSNKINFNGSKVLENNSSVDTTKDNRLLISRNSLIYALVITLTFSCLLVVTALVLSTLLLN